MTHVVVLGGGSSAEALCRAFRRHDTDSRVTMVERELVGGECTYWACMPSKTLLRATELVAAAEITPGVDGARLVPAEIFAWRDKVVDGWQDEGHVPWLEERDVELVRGDARVAPSRRPLGRRRGARVRRARDRDRLARRRPARPRPRGGRVLDEPRGDLGDEVPESLVVLGAGPSAASSRSSSAASARGSRSSTARAAARRASDPSAGALLGERRSPSEGIELRLGASLERVEPGVRVHLGGGARRRGRAPARRHRPAPERGGFRLRAARRHVSARDRGRRAGSAQPTASGRSAT